jgi:transcriptional regulator with XRE-family HTH domain
MTSEVMVAFTSPAYRGHMARANVGELVREWRSRRHRSQMDLALDVGVSPRHLSFVETGRSKPSPELILALADNLDVPLRERNTLLLAAGYAPRYSQSPLDDPAREFARASVTRMLDAHHPYPGIAIDRHWNVVVANEAAFAITAGLPDSLLGPPVNVYRISLHPDGLAARTHDFAEWAVYQLRQLRRSIVLTGDRELEELYEEVRSYPGVAELDERDHEWFDDDPPLLLPFRIDVGGTELSFFTTLTAFATPLDVTLAELAIELFFPADAEPDALLQSGSMG